MLAWKIHKQRSVNSEVTMKYLCTMQWPWKHIKVQSRLRNTHFSAFTVQLNCRNSLWAGTQSNVVYFCANYKLGLKNKNKITTKQIKIWKPQAFGEKNNSNSTIILSSLFYSPLSSDPLYSVTDSEWEREQMKRVVMDITFFTSNVSCLLYIYTVLSIFNLVIKLKISKYSCVCVYVYLYIWIAAA